MPTFPAQAGAIGIPAGLKEEGKRVDFKPDDYALLIETKGYRISWERSAQCPCTGNNDQTDQADPNCSLCSGKGWIQFKPVGAVVNDLIIGELTTLQTKVIGTNGAVVRGVMSGIVNTMKPWDKVQARLEGTLQVSVRSENKLGYWDKLTNLDAVVVYSQLLDSSGTLTDTLRYLADGINLLRSDTTTYVEGTDFNLVDGDIVWVSGQEPAADSRLVCHYLTHPTWRVIEHPHAMRVTPVKFKTAKPTTPQGDPRDLPVQAVVKYEWLAS